MNDFKEISRNWITSQQIINLDKKVKFFKTHHAYCKINNNYFTDSENTKAAIYIVRDPRNVITSLLNHLLGHGKIVITHGKIFQKIYI